MIDVGQQPSATKTRNKLTILLMDGSSERRALRKRIMALHGVEVVGACDLTEATSIWRRDRYDAVLIDIRRDHHGCIALGDEIKKEKPQQIVAFLVGAMGRFLAESNPGKLRLPTAEARLRRSRLAHCNCKEVGRNDFPHFAAAGAN